MDLVYSIENYQEIELFIPAQVTQLRSNFKEKFKLEIPENRDDFLARCLRMKDGNLEKAVTLVKSFYDATAQFKKWDAMFQPSLHSQFYNLPMVIPIMQRDSTGRIILVTRIGMWNPDEMGFDQAVACFWMVFQYITAKSQDAQRYGFVMIYDYTQFSMKHALALNKWRLPYIAKVIQNGVFGRIKEHHVINHPRIVSIIYSGLKPFLKEKLKRRTFFHDDPANLFSHVDKKILPTLIGGSLETEECMDKELTDDFFNQDNYFKDMIKDRFPTK